jgi:hypothetical protein
MCLVLAIPDSGYDEKAGVCRASAFFFFPPQYLTLSPFCAEK